MGTIYRTIGKVERKKPKWLLGQYDVPIEAVHLAQDILKLEQTIKLLQQIDPFNISATDTVEARRFAEEMLQSQLALVRSWNRYANLKLRKYLAP